MPRVGFVKPVPSPEPGRTPRGLVRLGVRVPCVEESVDELCQNPGREANARSDEHALVECGGTSKEDGECGEGGTCPPVGSKLPGIPALARGHAAHLLEERARGGDVDGPAQPLGRTELEKRLHASTGRHEQLHPGYVGQGFCERPLNRFIDEPLACVVHRRRATHVSFEESHRADRKRRRELRLAAVEQREFRRPAADVDQDCAPRAQRQTSRDRELDQSRLFDRLDHLELDPSLASHALDEHSPVFRFAHGARRHGSERVDVRSVKLGAKLSERLARPADRSRRARRPELKTSAPRRTAALRFATSIPGVVTRLVREELELRLLGVCRPRRVHDSKAYGVRADVDCGEARHELKLAAQGGLG